MVSESNFKQEIYLIGAGGLAKDFISVFFAEKHINIKGIYDDSSNISQISGIPVLGRITDLLETIQELHLVLCIGQPSLRLDILNRLKHKINLKFPNVYHNKSKIYDEKTVRIGIGNIFFPGAYITGNATVGDFCLFHLNSGLHHDCVLGNHVLLMPGVVLYKGEIKLQPLRIERSDLLY